MSKSNVSHARFKKGKILEGLSEYQPFFFPFLVGLDYAPSSHSTVRGEDPSNSKEFIPMAENKSSEVKGLPQNPAAIMYWLQDLGQGFPCLKPACLQNGDNEQFKCLSTG